MLGVIATLFIVSPASAARLSTTMENTSTMFNCPSLSNCTRLGGAPAGTAARSYCLIGSVDLIFSEGAANRFGFVPRADLVNENQNTNCLDGGFPTSVDDDVDLRRCANVACSVISDLTSSDTLHQYCQRNDSAGNVWIAVFNENGLLTGFAPAAELNNAPAAGLPSC